MKLSENAIEICGQNYGGHKNPGCGRCPLYSTCHNGRNYPCTTDGNNSYIKAINDQAEAVGVAAINAKLKIVKLGHQTFRGAEGSFKPTGYALHHEELGYFAFEGDCPYRPVGGREALQSILDAGGFIDFDTSVWIREI
jgi:hypothetical protein